MLSPVWYLLVQSSVTYTFSIGFRELAVKKCAFQSPSHQYKNHLYLIQSISCKYSRLIAIHLAAGLSSFFSPHQAYRAPHPFETLFLLFLQRHTRVALTIEANLRPDRAPRVYIGIQAIPAPTVLSAVKAISFESEGGDCTWFDV